MIQMKRMPDSEIVSLVRLLTGELKRRHGGGAGRPRKRYCSQRHDLTLTRVYDNAGRSAGCGICRGRRSKPQEPVCICTHDCSAHKGGECYHIDDKRVYDCSCVKYARAKA